MLAPTGTRTARSASCCACSTRVLGCVEVARAAVLRAVDRVRAVLLRAVDRVLDAVLRVPLLFLVVGFVEPVLLVVAIAVLLAPVVLRMVSGSLAIHRTHVCKPLARSGYIDVST